MSDATSDAGADLGPPDDGPPAAVCVVNGVGYPVGGIVPRGTATCSASCVCLADGTIGHCTGSCPEDAAAADTGSSSDLCTGSGGSVVSAACCAATGDFPNTCLVGACGCSPSASHDVLSCACPAGECYDPSSGCVGSLSVCTVGNDQSCNDNPGVNGFHGTCVAGGHCACHTGFTLLASGRCS
jgi:hypothetical protein